jgi:WD40 repeat protein
VRAVSRADGPVQQITFSPDGRLLAFAGDDGWARVRRVFGGAELFRREVGAAGGVSFSPDGESLVLHGDAGAPVQVSSTAGEVECVLEQAGRPAADAVLAGDYAVIVRNARGYVWDRAGCRLRQTVEDLGRTAVRVVASPGGDRVAFVSGRDARIVEVPSGRIVLRLEHPGAITSFAFSADGETIVTGGRDRLARVWSGVTGRLRRELRGQRGEILDVAIDPEGIAAATVSTDGTGRIWDVVPGTVQAILFGHTNFVRAVDFSPDGQSIVTASLDGTARTWAINGRPLAILAGHTGAVLDAAFSPDGSTVATGGEDGTVRIWDAETRGELVRGDAAAPRPARRVATSPDGTVTARVGGRLIELRRADGATSELVGHTRLVTSVDFSPDGRRLVSASRDRDAILWDASSGKALRVLRGHFGPVSDARFSPDGRWIVTAGPRSVGLWLASTAELIRLLRGPPGPFTAVSFTPDSRTIVAAFGKGVLTRYVCRLCGGVPELLELADERLAATGRQLTAEERELYLG